jgi:hypothetical protein
MKLVNGRDYFMKWQGDYWQRSFGAGYYGDGHQVKWQTDI